MAKGHRGRETEVTLGDRDKGRKRNENGQMKVAGGKLMGTKLFSHSLFLICI